MTVPERLITRPTVIHRSQHRESTRNTEVRSNSYKDRHNVPTKLQNRTTFRHRTGVRALRTVSVRPCANLQAICHPLKSHSQITASVATHQRLTSNGPIETAPVGKTVLNLASTTGAVPIGIYRF
jgi:hypothetical protein